MNKKFLQSVAAGIVGLTLAVSCSQGAKKDSNTCAAKHKCSAKKDEANKCSSKDAKAEKKAKKAKKVDNSTK